MKGLFLAMRNQPLARNAVFSGFFIGSQFLWWQIRRFVICPDLFDRHESLGATVAAQNVLNFVP